MPAAATLAPQPGSDGACIPYPTHSLKLHVISAFIKGPVWAYQGAPSVSFMSSPPSQFWNQETCHDLSGQFPRSDRKLVRNPSLRLSACMP